MSQYTQSQYKALPRLLPTQRVQCRDQQLYKQVVGWGGATQPERLTHPEAKQRFADGVTDVARNRLVIIVEDHSGEGEAVNSVAAVGKRF